MKRTKSSGRWSDARILLTLLLFHILFVVLVGGMLTFLTYISILLNADRIPSFLLDFLRNIAPGEDVLLLYAGLVSSVVYLPMALSIEYYVALEMKEGKKVRGALEKALWNYPIFIGLYAGFLFLNTFAITLVPVYLLFLLWRGRKRVDFWVLFPFLLSLTLIPFADTVRTSFYLRRVVSFLTMLSMPVLAFLAARPTSPPLPSGRRRSGEEE